MVSTSAVASPRPGEWWGCTATLRAQTASSWVMRYETRRQRWFKDGFLWIGGFLWMFDRFLWICKKHCEYTVQWSNSQQFAILENLICCWKPYLVGGFTEKYESQLGSLFPIWWESHKSNVPNHQAVSCCWRPFDLLPSHRCGVQPGSCATRWWCPRTGRKNHRKTIGNWGFHGIYSWFMIAKLVYNSNNYALWYL